LKGQRRRPSHSGGMRRTGDARGCEKGNCRTERYNGLKNIRTEEKEWSSRLSPGPCTPPDPVEERRQ